MTWAGLVPGSLAVRVFKTLELVAPPTDPDSGPLPSQTADPENNSSYGGDMFVKSPSLSWTRRGVLTQPSSVTQR